MKKKLTKADLKKTLASLGFKEGEELIIPSEKQSDANSSTTDEGEGEDEEDDGNGGNHPPKKGGN